MAWMEEGFSRWEKGEVGLEATLVIEEITD
jgi:hypothetical protein